MRMDKIIIDCSKNIIKTAVVDEKGLVELIIDKRDERSLVGNIYAGVVRNILPNQFAFVDIGQDKNGFLFLNDIKESRLYSSNQKLLIKNGIHILVQVVKDSSGEKGAYLTTQLSFSGRLCVLLLTGNSKGSVSVSKKITNNKECKRLKQIAAEILPKGYNLIIRTNCAGKAPEEIESELRALLKKSEDIAKRWEYLKPPCIVDCEENIISKNLRDLYNQNTIEVVINDSKEAENARISVKHYFQGAQNRIKHYEKDDIFEYYNINDSIKKILNKKVWLSSGGFVVIEKTEACFVIDVNSGKFLGNKNHEQSALKLNIEACREIARQIRLRNLCGIIIIDFIDMKNPASKEKLIHEFTAELKKDRISTNIAGMTNLGLIEVTRKKTRVPVFNMLCSIGD